ncbi:hypothetical protein [Sporosarcina sp. FSL K6-1508]|uniref:hypothetical protein n=1 Tax=Sporosarcina sp. FSL K6-1508 TaxID=2921553 RepID=UPI0030F8063F
MSEWLEVMQKPDVMIPAIISGVFTLIGAFLGVFLSSKSAYKLAKYSRQDSTRRELHDFKVCVENLELNLQIIHSPEKIDTLTKASLITMIDKVRNERYIEKLESIKKPTTIGAIDINNLKSSLNFLEYCLIEKEDTELTFTAYQRYVSGIRGLKISLDVAYLY